MKFPHTYKLLKTEGHTPAKAVEILLAARRGDKQARCWIVIFFRNRNQ